MKGLVVTHIDMLDSTSLSMSDNSLLFYTANEIRKSTKQGNLVCYISSDVDAPYKIKYPDIAMLLGGMSQNQEGDFYEDEQKIFVPNTGQILEYDFLKAKYALMLRDIKQTSIIGVCHNICVANVFHLLVGDTDRLKYYKEAYDKLQQRERILS